MLEAEYKYKRLRDPSYFDPKSLRTMKVGKHRVIVGCPRGKYDPDAERCRVGMKAQAILYSKRSNPSFFGDIEDFLFEVVLEIEELLGEIAEWIR